MHCEHCEYFCDERVSDFKCFFCIKMMCFASLLIWYITPVHRLLNSNELAVSYCFISSFALYVGFVMNDCSARLYCRRVFRISNINEIVF